MGKAGRVILIGVSSGGLFPPIARNRLEQADVIVCDRLIDAQVLCGIDSGKIVYAGKSANRGGNQSDINRLLIGYAREGKIVVRLKGGDALIFSRGGEEIESLSNAGIEFEIIPGITSASLAGAYAGIPLTHRDCSSSVCFVAGHRKKESWGNDDALLGIGGKACEIAKRGTIVLYMSVGQMRRNMESLMKSGVESNRPVAVIENAGTGLQRVIEGTVGTIADVCETQSPVVEPPAVIIIGDVVRFRNGKSWYERQPMFGQVVVITRPACRSGELYDRLTELGAYVLSVPSIEYEDVDEYDKFDNAIIGIAKGEYDWVVFTSQKSVESVAERLRVLRIDIRSLGNVRIGVIGRATGKTLERYMIWPELMPEEYTSEGLGRALLRRGVKGQKVLLVRADIGGNELRDMLEREGACVRRVTGYKIKLRDEMNDVVLEHLRKVKRIDWVTFTSPSVVRGFWRLAKEYGFEPKVSGAKFLSIGPVTTKELVSMGKKVFAEAREHTIDGMIKEIVNCCILGVVR